MPATPLKGHALRSADYDRRAQRLQLEFADRSVRTYKGVPQEVFDRLCAAPNAGAYFDDRIRDEYPWERASAGSDSARGRADDLFGGQL